ncbi:complement factor H-like isoform X2 [Dromiciops gliroides]|uniref:complement factor H-like isoform X2 n=1 Tax=Dromiciops gliroides TaxID=33562 RepID=UPI001CC7741D|nr:complement factor H-like isoform X2 [Dromiciops gliroides]
MMMHHFMITFILWSSYTVGQVLKCEEPPNIDFGQRVNDGKTEYHEGDRVWYQCSPGTTPVGSEWIECHEKNWTPPPKCSVPCTITRQQLEEKKLVLSNGQSQGVIILHNQSLEFSCADGYTLTKPSVRTCVDGHMNFPTCILVGPCDFPEVENGELYTPSYYSEEYYRSLFPASIGKLMHYSCNKNYVSPYGSASSYWTTFICTVEGWSPVPKCLRKCSLYSIQNGRFWPTKGHYKEGEEITVQCSKGFSLPNNEDKITCTKDGWSTDTNCKRIMRPCDFPEIENGTLYINRYSEEYQRSLFPAPIGKEMHYHCNENYVSAYGSASSYWTKFICTAGGWSPVPKCLKTCTRKNYFENGFFSESKIYYPVNTLAKYQCKEGYATTDGKKEGFVTCGQQGWLNQPKCIKICDIPHFENARYKGNKTFLKPMERLEYECMDGYEMTNGQTRGFKTCDNDEWPTVLECYEKVCHLPILHGNLHPDPRQDKYKVGDVLTFRCTNGFKLVGPLSVQCYHFGWSPSIPTCKQKVKCCDQPPEILNGTPKDSNKKEYCHNDVVEYNCDLGFVSRGPKKIQCNDGEWTTLPTCIEYKRRCAEVPELVHGYVQTTSRSYSHGASVECGCEEDYTMIGSKTVTCSHGNWTPVPTCIETYQLGRCPSKFFEDLQVNLYQNGFGDIFVNYTCNSNSEFKRTQCLNGKWLPEPKCPKRKSCAPPPQIPNAQNMTTTMNYQDGEKIGVFCKENYLLQGQEEIICENGQWNSLPRCIEKQPCSKPPAIQYGGIKPVRHSEAYDDNLESSTYAHNSVVNYTCQEGFTMKGKEEITCSMGKWSSPPQCVGISCGKPPKIQNGIIPDMLNSYEFDEEVTYKCLEGYNIDGPATIKCIGGTWSSPPQCKDVKCAIPPQFNNAHRIGIAKHNYLPGEKVAYQCLPNFHSEGSTEVTCIGGSWKGDPQCKDNSCGPAPQIENAEIISDIKAKYQPGDIVSYNCVRSLKMYGKSYIRCVNKSWTELPQCKEEVGKCGPPPPINNGDTINFLSPEYAPGSTVEYRCQQFYVLQGSPIVTCRNGLWTREPTCLESCTASKEMMTKNNIELRWRNDDKLYSRTGQEMEFTCRWGYRLAPRSPPLRATCVEGKINYPKCIY